MFKPIVVVMLSSLALSACQSQPRPFDGTLGYQFFSVQDPQVRLDYTEEARRPAAYVEQRATRACAKHLGVTAEAISLSLLTKSEFIAAVSMSVPIPVGMTSSGSTANSAGQSPVSANYVQSTVTQRNELLRDMLLSKYSFSCALTPGAASAAG